MQLLATIGSASTRRRRSSRGADRDRVRCSRPCRRSRRPRTIVRFVGITASAFEVTIWLRQTRDWNEFLAIREEFFSEGGRRGRAAGTALTGTGDAARAGCRPRRRPPSVSAR
jgi:hypothetical protein